MNKFLPRELEIYLKLDHPNIIKVHEILEIMHKVYIFMELAEGGDLLDFIRVTNHRHNQSKAFCLLITVF